jgi:asparagine synthase (glutamine-hydrolysing)
MARRFFGQNLGEAGNPGFGHGPRWRSAAALQRLFSPEFRHEMDAADVVGRIVGSLPGAFRSWDPLAQDQYIETRTLLSGYLLSAQGDRMLMANSVEGRFPFLDIAVVEAANALPSCLKLRGLREKQILRMVARDLVPPSIVDRAKQPMRAPDAAALSSPRARKWADELMEPDAIASAGIFDVGGIRQLWKKCVRAAAAEPPSNADNQALAGVLSTALLHRGLLRSNLLVRSGQLDLTTDIDRTNTTIVP